MAQTSQWEAPRWACHQGAGGSCVPLRYEKGYTWGQVWPALKDVAAWEAWPEAGRQAGGRGPGVETAWLAE